MYNRNLLKLLNLLNSSELLFSKELTLVIYCFLICLDKFMFLKEFLKSVFYMNNLETPSAAIKISSFGPLIFGKQKGSEEHIITIVYRNMGSNYRNFDDR